MCGILGSINRSFPPTVLDLLRHRGPDDSGIIQELVGHHRVTLGHRRLAIVDLSPAGRQPMRTLDNNCTIVFNGEVYNHKELRSQGPAIHYRGYSDTETVLNYLSQKGVGRAQQLNGIFALGLLDIGNRKLYLVRDPFGVKPLYYWFDSHAFLFSSELRPLYKLTEDAVDPENLAELLRLRYLPAPDTLFRNIRKVRPGHIVEVDLKGVQLSVCEYPFAEPAPDEAPVRSRQEASECYGYLVEQAVQRQLMSDVKIGVFLSGGVDSALIASLAQRHCPYRMKAFTVGFAGREYADEIPEAEATAAFVGLEHHHVRIDFKDFLNLLARVTSIVEEPIATTSVIPMYSLAALASKHGKVVLSGQGVDEAMGGYRRYQAELLQSCAPRWAIRLFERSACRIGLRNDTILRGLSSAQEREDVRRFESVYSVFSGDQIVRLVGTEPTRALSRIQYFFDLLKCARYRQSVQRMMAVDLRMNLADDLLLYTDKITMHHSLECRVPLLDLDLVRFAQSLPTRFRVGCRRGKILHKLSAERILPSSLVRRKKKGFLSPTNEWFRKTTIVREILLDSTSLFASYCNLEEVKKVLSEHDAGMNRERHIFLLLGLYYWFSETARAKDVPPIPAVVAN